MTFKLINGTPPAVAIVKPKAKQTFRTFTTTTKTVTKNGKKVKTKTRKRTKIQIAGLSKAAAGATMQRVLLTLQKTKSTDGSTTKCRFYDAKRGLRLVSCAKPILITARLVKDSASGEWTYNVADDAAAVARQLEGLGLRRRHDRRVRQLRPRQGRDAPLHASRSRRLSRS